jgi:hypothetical protein
MAMKKGRGAPVRRPDARLPGVHPPLRGLFWEGGVEGVGVGKVGKYLLFFSIIAISLLAHFFSDAV